MSTFDVDGLPALLSEDAHHRLKDVRQHPVLLTFSDNDVEDAFRREVTIRQLPVWRTALSLISLLLVISLVEDFVPGHDSAWTNFGIRLQCVAVCLLSMLVMRKGALLGLLEAMISFSMFDVLVSLLVMSWIRAGRTLDDLHFVDPGP